MTWQQNLFSNLIVIGVLVTLGVIMYAKIKNKTLVEIFQEVKQIFSGGVDEQPF